MHTCLELRMRNTEANNARCPAGFWHPPCVRGQCWASCQALRLLVRDTLQQLMSSWAQAANTRQACSATLLAFLLDYPLGPKRVEFHFNFLLSNLQVRCMLISGCLQV